MRIILIELAILVVLFIVVRALRPKVRFFRGGYVVRRDSYMQDKSMKILIEDTKFLRGKERNNRSIRVDGTNLIYSRIPLDKEQKVLMVYSYCAPLMAMVKGSGAGLDRALVLGGGGGAVPLYILQSYESTKVDVVEISEDSIRTSTKYFLADYEGSGRVNLIQADAQSAVTSLAAPYQFIFCDLYIGGEPVNLVFNPAFMGEVSRLAGPDGMLVINAASLTMEGVHMVLVTLLAAFKNAWCMLLNEGFVIMACNKDMPALDSLLGQGGVIAIYPPALNADALREQARMIRESEEA